MSGFSQQFLIEVRNILGLAADADPQTILAEMDRQLEALANPPVATKAPTPPLPASPPGLFDGHRDAVAWAVATGRLSPARAQFWAAQLVEERARTGSTVQIEATIASLSPVYDVAAARRPAVAESDTPLLDDLDRAMYGPSIEERERADNLAAERELAESVEREREQAAGQLTESEEQAIFGDSQ